MRSEGKNLAIPFSTNRLITVDDLRSFKLELLLELRQIINGIITGKPQKKWMKSFEVRALLDISPGTLQTMRNSKAISFTKIGGMIYYDRDDIQTMLERNKIAKK